MAVNTHQVSRLFKTGNWDDFEIKKDLSVVPRDQGSCFFPPSEDKKARSLSKAIATVGGLLNRNLSESELKRVYQTLSIITYYSIKTLRPQDSEQILGQLRLLKLPEGRRPIDEVIKIISVKALEGTQFEFSFDPEQNKPYRGIFCLTHCTSIKALPDLLRQKTLYPYVFDVLPGIEGRGGGTRTIHPDHTFFSCLPAVGYISKRSDPEEQFEDFFMIRGYAESAILVLDPKLLENRDFHISVGWIWGNREPGKTYRSTQLENYLAFHNGYLMHNEVVVSGSVSLEPFLKEIWVLPGRKKTTVEALKARQIFFKNDPQYQKIVEMNSFRAFYK